MQYMALAISFFLLSILFKKNRIICTPKLCFKKYLIGHHAQLYSKLAFLSLDVEQVHIQACSHANNEEIVSSLQAQCNSEESP